MRCFLLSFVIVGSVIWPTSVRSQPTDRPPTKTIQVIPLDHIWAWEMPGTRNLRELEPEKFGEHTRSLPSAERFQLLNESLLDQIRTTLKRARPPKNGTAQAGFAVLGTGREALEGAADIFLKDKKPIVTFPFGANVTLVFFSHSCGQYVHLKRIEQRGNKFEVNYQLVPHSTSEMTWHMALIPVGNLPLGSYQVDITPLADGKDNNGHLVSGLSASEAQRIVCRSFSFSVIPRQKEP